MVGRLLGAARVDGARVAREPLWRDVVIGGEFHVVDVEVAIDAPLLVVVVDEPDADLDGAGTLHCEGRRVLGRLGLQRLDAQRIEDEPIDRDLHERGLLARRLLVGAHGDRVMAWRGDRGVQQDRAVRVDMDDAVSGFPKVVASVARPRA